MDILDRLIQNNDKLKAYKDLAAGKPLASNDAATSKPSQPEGFRDVSDSGLKGTVQAIAFGKGKIPPPTDALNARPQQPQSQPVVSPQAKGPNATMTKIGTSPNLSTEGTWGASPGQARWSR